MDKLFLMLFLLLTLWAGRADEVLYIADLSGGNMELQKFFGTGHVEKLLQLAGNRDAVIENMLPGEWSSKSSGVPAVAESFCPVDEKSVNADVFALLPVVVLVSKDNPLENISVSDLQRIYSGKVGNWQRLGGANAKLYYAGCSGEQGVLRAFKTLVMKQNLFAAEKQVLNESAPGFIDCGGKNGAAALLKMQKGVIVFGSYELASGNAGDHKVLKINGVYPDKKSILSGRYPLVVKYLLLHRKNSSCAYKKAILDFLISRSVVSKKLLSPAAQ